MMENALSVRNLNKTFPDFALHNISFDVPKGSVVGIIGENGSGKSTTLKCILGQDIPSSGTVEIFGINPYEDIKAHDYVGAAFDTAHFPDNFCANDIAAVLSRVFVHWNWEVWESLLKNCRLNPTQPIGKFSRGMKAKISLAAALSHEASLLILDEATVGLDPVIREEMLELLLDFMQQDGHAILMTSHITSDLEKIADYIVFIKDGRIEFVEEKDTLLDQYAMVQVSQSQQEFIQPEFIVRKRRLPLACELLIKGRQEFMNLYPDYALSPATLDEIVLMFIKGEKA